MWYTGSVILTRLSLMPAPRKAFTLVELLIVVAIIGLIATIAGVGMSGARAKSRDNKRMADIRQVQKALEIGFSQGNGYPVVAGPTTLGLATTDVLCGQGTVVAFVADASPANCDADKIYIGLVPANPTPNGTAYSYRSLTPAGAACTSGTCTNYCIQLSLETSVPNTGLSAGNVVAEPGALRNGTCP